MAQGAPQAGEIYRHFKNKLYQVITVARHSETGEKYVVYQALYGHFQAYVRPYEMFVSEVERDKYPDADQKYRFALVEFGGDDGNGDDGNGSDGSGDDRSGVNGSGNDRSGVDGSGGENAGNSERVGNAGNGACAGRVDPRLLQFLDADTMEDKLKLLEKIGSSMTDRLVDDFAASMDVVIPEGDLYDRIHQLRSCIRTRSQYELRRFR